MLTIRYGTSIEEGQGLFGVNGSGIFGGCLLE
jgi:hypothetical protein